MKVHILMKVTTTMKVTAMRVIMEIQLMSLSMVKENNTMEVRVMEMRVIFQTKTITMTKMVLENLTEHLRSTHMTRRNQKRNTVITKPQRVVNRRKRARSIRKSRRKAVSPRSRNVTKEARKSTLKAKGRRRTSNTRAASMDMDTSPPVSITTTRRRRRQVVRATRERNMAMGSMDTLMTMLKDMHTDATDTHTKWHHSDTGLTHTIRT